MPKDFTVLRDLWYSIDPTCPLADPTHAKSMASERMASTTARNQKAVGPARKQRLNLQHAGKRVPKSLENYLVGLDGDGVRRPVGGTVVRNAR